MIKNQPKYKKLFLLCFIFSSILAKGQSIPLNEQEKTYGIPIDNSCQAKYSDERVKFLIFHYTACNLPVSIQILCHGNATHQVSSHYLVSDQGGKIYSFVEEHQRAWHAGSSNWENRINLNDTSIGIEIVNLGFKKTPKEITWYPFNEGQIQSIIQLAKGIIEKYKISPFYVLGHSDIAPNRKEDPGPLFPWRRLAKHGIGMWYDEDQVREETFSLRARLEPISIAEIQKNFKEYGYAIEPTGIVDDQTKNVIKVFQMHFRPINHSGNLDYETIAILRNLLKKKNEIIANK